jgi:hypothetical protein
MKYFYWYVGVVLALYACSLIIIWFDKSPNANFEGGRGIALGALVVIGGAIVLGLLAGGWAVTILIQKYSSQGATGISSAIAFIILAVIGGVVLKQFLKPSNQQRLKKENEDFANEIEIAVKSASFDQLITLGRQAKNEEQLVKVKQAIAQVGDSKSFIKVYLSIEGPRRQDLEFRGPSGDKFRDNVYLPVALLESDYIQTLPYKRRVAHRIIKELSHGVPRESGTSFFVIVQEAQFNLQVDDLEEQKKRIHESLNKFPKDVPKQDSTCGSVLYNIYQDERNRWRKPLSERARNGVLEYHKAGFRLTAEEVADDEIRESLEQDGIQGLLVK